MASERVFEIGYESLASAPQEAMTGLLEYLGEDAAAYPRDALEVHPEQNKYLEKLDDEQIREVLQRTAEYREVYGYGDTP